MADFEGPHRGSATTNDAMSGVRPGFPRTEEEFKDDVRVSFDRLNGKHLLEDDDGKEYEWNDKIQRWIESTDEALLEQQRSAYRMPGVDEDEPVNFNASKKRKGSDDAGPSKKAKKEPTERANTAVYVTGIPLDASPDDVEKTFNRFGIIARNVDNDTPKINLYNDEEGAFKGDALVVFFRPESVRQAIVLADETNFRTGLSGAMRVQAADRSYKKQQDAPSAEQVQKNRKTAKDRQKVINLTNRMNAKLADWDDDDPSAIKDDEPSKWDYMVVLKHLFTLDALKTDPDLALDVKDDVREQCEEKCGAVADVTVYDLEPDGVVTVRFKDHLDAPKCVRLMRGRLYEGRKLVAYVPRAKERFRKAREPGAGIEDPHEAEAARLAAYGRELDEEDARANAEGVGNGGGGGGAAAA